MRPPESILGENPSHRHLLVNDSLPPVERPRKIDAIFVPTIRRAEWGFANNLASELDVPVIFMTSEMLRFEAARKDPFCVVALPDGFEQPLLEFRADRHDRSQRKLQPQWDLDRKRNLALVVSKLAGYERILFLDDDIRALSPRLCNHAAHLLDSYPIVAPHIRHFPDNSVIGHALRRIGAAQEVFASGAALFVRVGEVQSFFPPIYNEDWLFMLPSIGLRNVASLGVARQLPYDPFACPSRAEAEEFGDLIAESLMAHMGNRSVAHRDISWADQLAARVDLLERLRDRLLRAGHSISDNIVRSVDRAREVANSIGARECEAFIEAIDLDRREWVNRMASLPMGGASLSEALRFLGLSSTRRRIA